MKKIIFGFAFLISLPAFATVIEHLLPCNQQIDIQTWQSSSTPSGISVLITSVVCESHQTQCQQQQMHSFDYASLGIVVKKVNETLRINYGESAEYRGKIFVCNAKP